MKLGEYLTAINYSKEPLLDTEDESVEKGYTPFIVNRCLSYFMDTENLDTIKQFYGYSDTKAKEVMDILSDDDIQFMRDKLNTGGVGK